MTSGAVDGAGGAADPSAAIITALDRLGRARRLHRQAIASARGLTTLQLDLLTALASGLPPVPSVGSLAREVGVSQPTTTDSLGALERKGLVRHERAATDRRRRVLTLTAHGRDVAADADRADDAARDAVAHLAPGEQEATLGSLLGLVTAFFDAGVIDVARTCLTCHFHQRTVAGGHRCSLLGTDLAPAELRVNCPEHVPATAVR